MEREEEGAEGKYSSDAIPIITLFFSQQSYSVAPDFIAQSAVIEALDRLLYQNMKKKRMRLRK